jgi:hypothetical protein
MTEAAVIAGALSEAPERHWLAPSLHERSVTRA